MSETAHQALRSLRRHRQRNRLGDIEWFDAAYRVYMVALFGGGGLLWLSGTIGDGPVSASTTASIADHGPSVIGLVAAMALLIGLRAGAQGGPLALEAADVSHVMLAPVNRRSALLRPALQRARSALTMSSVLGAIAGQLAGRRLPGTPLAWAGGGALFGAAVGLTWVGAALLAHGFRVPLWMATTIGLVTLGWQGAAAADLIGVGPADLHGSLAMWGWRQEPVDLVAVAIAIGAVIVGLGLLHRSSLEALARRSGLVAQLRFAVTMQDLRTVVLLRRQLNQERTRTTPWLRLPSRGRSGLWSIAWRRGNHSLLRLPASRLVRMAALAAAIGIAQGIVARGTTAMVAVAAMLIFILGLEVLEPLSQEVDQPDRTDSFPVERGALMLRMLTAPALALVPLAVIAGAAAVITIGIRTEVIAATAVLALPMLMAGAMGSVFNVVRDAPDPYGAATQQAFMPPEMAGFSMLVKTAFPVLISLAGAATVFFPRAAFRAGDDGAAALAAASLRGSIGAVLLIAGVCAWVTRRDRIRRWFRTMMADSRNYRSSTP